MASLFLLLFISHIIMKKILFYIYIDDNEYQLINEAEENLKMMNINGKDVYEIATTGLFRYESFVNELKVLKSEYERYVKI
jgi:hypothetical protein